MSYGPSRVCSVCKQEKPLNSSYFHSGDVRNGLFSHTCKPCANERSRKRYWAKVRGSEEQRRTNQQAVARNRATKAAIVAERGGKCEACGREFHPVCFDFHHPGHDRKGDLPPSKYGSYGIERMRKAVQNLQMLCANCHRLAHWGDDVDGTLSVKEGK